MRRFIAVWLLPLLARLVSAQNALLSGTYCQWNFTDTVDASYAQQLGYAGQQCAASSMLWRWSDCATSNFGSEGQAAYMQFEAAPSPITRAFRPHSQFNQAQDWAALTVFMAPAEGGAPFDRFFINVWFYVEYEEQLQMRQTIIGAANTFQSDPIFMGLFGSTRAGRFDKLCFARQPPNFIDSVGVPTLICSSYPVRVGMWHMATIAWLQSDINDQGRVNLFLDGRLQTTYTFAGPTIAGFTNPGPPQQTGLNYFDFSVGGSNFCPTNCVLPGGGACPPNYAPPNEQYLGLLGRMIFAKTWPTESLVQSMYNELAPFISGSGDQWVLPAYMISSSSSAVSSSYSSSQTSSQTSSFSSSYSSSQTSSQTSSSSSTSDHRSSSSTLSSASSSIPSTLSSSVTLATSVQSSTSAALSSATGFSSASPTSSIETSALSSTSGGTISSSSTSMGAIANDDTPNASNALPIVAVIGIAVGGALVVSVVLGFMWKAVTQQTVKHAVHATKYTRVPRKQRA